MAGDKYLKNSGGLPTEQAASQSSAGAGDAGKIVALGSDGRLDLSMMPTGIGPDTATIVASEALSAGDLVNIWNDAGAFRVRKADASTTGKEAHGFVQSGVAMSANALVYFEGPNTQKTGLTAGVQFLSVTTPGDTQATAPTGAGQIAQRVGFATSATALNFQSFPPIVLA